MPANGPLRPGERWHSLEWFGFHAGRSSYRKAGRDRVALLLLRSNAITSFAPASTMIELTVDDEDALRPLQSVRHGLCGRPRQPHHSSRTGLRDQRIAIGVERHADRIEQAGRETGAGDAEFVRFQKSWFAELHEAGYAVPHWPSEWGGGLRTRGAARKMSVPEQIVLYQELAAYDAPRLVLAFVGIHHAASTLLAAGSDEQRRRHLPAILDGEIWVQGFSEPEAGSDLASLRTSARRIGDSYVVNGQKLWASGGMYADWCLLLARTDPDAPKRKGISYFLLDMTTPGVEVRPIRNAIGDSHFCEIFLNDVSIPAANLVGVENAGWQVAQATLGAERGLTMLELAERLGNAGFRWLVQASPARRPDRGRPAGAVRNRDRRAARVVPEGGGGQRGRDGRPR